MIILYTFTLIPLSYVFTTFVDSYWYYYSFVFFIAYLSSWLFFNIFEDISKGEYDIIKILIEYELMIVGIAIVFIVIPLILSNYVNFWNEKILVSIMDDANLKEIPKYIGPNRLLSSFIFLIVSNCHIMFTFIKERFIGTAD
jgi:hypothetical protein